MWCGVVAIWGGSLGDSFLLSELYGILLFHPWGSLPFSIPRPWLSLLPLHLSGVHPMCSHEDPQTIQRSSQNLPGRSKPSFLIISDILKSEWRMNFNLVASSPHPESPPLDSGHCLYCDPQESPGKRCPPTAVLVNSIHLGNRGWWSRPPWPFFPSLKGFLHALWHLGRWWCYGVGTDPPSLGMVIYWAWTLSLQTFLFECWSRRWWGLHQMALDIGEKSS